MRGRTQRFRVGFRREILILLPVALLLLVLLSTFTLVSYRNGLELLTTEREDEATLVASKIAERVSSGALPTARELRRQALHAARVALLDSSLQVVVETAPAAADDRLRLGGSALEQPVALESAASPPGRIVAVAPTVRNGRRYLVRVELQAVQLMSQKRKASTLMWFVLTVNGSLAILLMLFLRHLLAPYDTLMAQAERILPRDESSNDEVAFLVSSFEKALEALKDRTEPDEIATLERMLGPNLESGLLLLSREGEVLALNALGGELLGVDVPQASGTSIENLLAPHAQFLELVTKALATREAVQREEVEIVAGEEARTLGLTLHPLRREGGSDRAYLLLFADLTETQQRAREERLAVSLAQVGELAAGVAHEMRNSLATIRGYLALAERKPEDGSLAEYLGDIRRESDHLQRVLEDFLTFARPGSTRMELLDLETLARRAAVDPALADFEVRVSSKPGLPPILGDPQLLERAIRNLLHNAAAAERQADSEGPLEVELDRDDEGLQLELSDRGVGIPEEIRERLFEPFVTGMTDGVGLGLSLAHRIVALHGGRLRLEDRPAGGSRAIVWLPLPTAGGAGDD